MNTSLKLLRMVWGALLVSILLYVLIGERAAHSRATLDPTMFRAIALVAILTVAILFMVRRVVVLRALRTLAGASNDSAALLRWRGGCIATFALCEAVALYGFVLRMQGFTLSQVAPFYISGMVLMVYFGPRRPASNAMAADASIAG